MRQERVRQWKGEDAYYFYKYYKESGFDPSTFFSKDTTKLVRIKAVAVQGTGESYQWLDVNVGDKDDVYNKLIKAAKFELIANGLPTNIDINTKSKISENEANAELKKNLVNFVNRAKLMIGDKFSIETLNKIRAMKPEKLTPEFREFVFMSLFSNESSRLQLVNIKKSKEFTNLLEALIRGGRGITELGFVNEVAMASIGEYTAKMGIGLISDAIQYGKTSKIAEINKGEAIYKESKKPYIPTNTIDLKLMLKESVNKTKANEFNISLKMSKDFYKVKYKEFTGSSGDPFTNIARWTNLTRTYIAWASFQKPSMLYAKGGNFAYYVAATFASLALGGFKENRALFLMKSNDKEITIKSLDVALKELKNITAFRFRDFKVINESDYTENVKKIGSMVHDNIDNVYKTYNNLKKINFNYSLRTLGPYQNLGG